MPNNQSSNNFKQKMKYSFYEQLHEQYAVNNNAYFGSIITLIVALMAVIGSYGYVFIQILNQQGGKDCCCHLESYTINSLMFVYLASCGVLAIMTCICAYQGVAQRNEQFIVFALRCKYDAFDASVFPKKYHPFFKRCLNIVQGHYGEFIKIFIWVFIVLSIITGYVVCCFCNCHCNCNSLCMPIIVCGVFVLLVLLSTWCYCRCQLKKYYEREQDYKIIFKKEYTEIWNIIKKYNNKNKKQKCCCFKSLKMAKKNLLKIIVSKTGTSQVNNNLLEVDGIASSMEMNQYVLMQSKCYEGIFGEKKKYSSDNMKRLSVVKITHNGKSIHRAFKALPATGLTENHVGLTPASIGLLTDSYNNSPMDVELSKGCKWKYYWYHPGSATRISFKFGMWSIGLAIISIILSVLFFIL